MSINSLTPSGMAPTWTSATRWLIYLFSIGGCAIKVASSSNSVHSCFKICVRYAKEWVSWMACQEMSCTGAVVITIDHHELGG